MIEGLLISNALKKKREKYTKKDDDDNDNKLTTAQAVIYLIIMVFSGVNAWQCYEGVDGRWWRALLAFLFPIIYALIRLFNPGMCERQAQQYYPSKQY
jgi:uncharacterized ion transporter superfamily protein YfcC